MENNRGANWTRIALATIFVHALVSFAHGKAHEQLGVALSSIQTIYVFVVIVLAPLVAGILLWRGMKTIGSIGLICSMAGSLAFGAYNHFVAISPDHIFHLSPAGDGNWILMFQMTAVVLSILEAIGLVAGMRLLSYKDR